MSSTSRSHSDPSRIAPTPRVSSAGRVLVIDEAAGRACAISEMLRSAGFEVIEVTSGDAAITASAQHSLDTVVLNLAAPELACFEIGRRLKAASPQILPLLYLSSRTSREARVRALDAGVDAYLAHPFDAKELRASVAALVRIRRQELKHMLETANNSTIGDALNSLGGAVVNVDITERRRLIASLEAERSRLETIFQEAPAFLAVLLGPDYIFERINPAYMQLVGHCDPVGKTLIDALPEIRGQGFIEMLDQVRETGVPISAKQLPVRLQRTPEAPLETRYVDVVYQRLVDANGGFAVVSHGVDVTDRVLAAEALQRSEHRMREQFAKMPVATYLWEKSGDDFVMVDCNEAAIETFPEYGVEAIGRRFRELFPELDDLLRDYHRSLAENSVIRRTVDFQNGSHGKKLLELTIGPQQPDRVLVHAVDATARAELEAQLRQAQKMDAIGRLAGGVAHDFNNLLTVIGAHTTFLLESVDSSDARHGDVEEIQKASTRAAGLTRQLLAFSRKQILKPRVLDLNAIIAEASKMLARLLGEDIEIVTNLAPDLGAVLADATQLDQVLVNLAVNARDAMPEGGVLTIASRNAKISDDVHNAHRVIPAGDYTLLEVNDTGIGMDVQVRARLFEPFFTTKESGKGTGLGLATVYGIVKQSGGYVMVESSPGRGTTFQIYLPAAVAADETDDLQRAEDVSIRGEETILLIEDEAAVREIAHRILKRKGYAVLLASSGEDALAVSAAHDSPIHLVISDSVMPGMNGAEVVRRLQAERPGLKALFMSGYTDDEILRRGVVSSTAAFIQKPFTLQEFARAAREALDN